MTLPSFPLEDKFFEDFTKISRHFFKDYTKEKNQLYHKPKKEFEQRYIPEYQKVVTRCAIENNDTPCDDFYHFFIIFDDIFRVIIRETLEEKSYIKIFEPYIYKYVFIIIDLQKLNK